MTLRCPSVASPAPQEAAEPFVLSFMVLSQHGAQLLIYITPEPEL